MTNNGFAIDYAAPPSVHRLAMAVTGFGVLLLLIFVGFDAFQPRTAIPGPLQGMSFLAAFAVVLIAALQRRGSSVLSAIPSGVALLLCWCLASVLWSAAPAAAIQGAGFQIVIVTGLLLSVDTLGAERAFRVWRWLLAAVLLVDFLSVALLPAARDMDGHWRGLYGDRNAAGAVCAITAILFLFAGIGWRNIVGIAIAAAACVFLVMTRSRPALGFLPLALAAGAIYRIGWRDGLSRTVLAAGGLLALLAAGAFVVLDAGLVSRIMEEPHELAARSMAWATALNYLRSHPLLGAGFDNSPPGYDGYLQVLVMLGGIGGTLTVLALAAQPLRRFWALDWDQNAFQPMLFALFVFLLLHNLLEPDFLAGGNVAWAALVLVIAALRQRDRHSLMGSF